MATFKNYREESKKQWGNNVGEITIEEVTLGATLRIADSLEEISKAIHRGEVRRIREEQKVQRIACVTIDRMGFSVEGVTSYVLAGWLTDLFGERADANDSEQWEMLANCHDIRGLGDVKRERIRKAAREHFASKIRGGSR
jgi:hypothetical protein